MTLAIITLVLCHSYYDTCHYGTFNVTLVPMTLVPMTLVPMTLVTMTLVYYLPDKQPLLSTCITLIN